MLKFGGITRDDVFYDLGSGDGRVLLVATNFFKTKRVIGYEVALWPYFKSRFFIRAMGFDKNALVFRENLLHADLSEATFIYIYLFPELVERAAQKISSECGSGIKVLCPSFPINTDRHPEFKLLNTQKLGRITAYLYQKS